MDKANPKSKSHVKSAWPTQQTLLEWGECPQHFPTAWLGREPEGDEVHLAHYTENDFSCYHDWPFRVEGAVFYNKTDAQEFAWNLSRNQKNRTVWIQTPTGFPQETSWWDDARLQRDGEYTEHTRKLAQAARDIKNQVDQPVPTQGYSVPEPSRAEANGRVSAYYDARLKRTIVTGETLEADSPNRAHAKKIAERLSKNDG